MEINESYVKEIIEKVLAGTQGESSAAAPAYQAKKQIGVFDTMTEALEAVQKAYKLFRKYSVAQREEMITKIRELTLNEAEVMARMGVEETKMGRIADKVIKHQLVAKKTPGTEDLKANAMTGDDGLTLVEMAPFGVIGSITPSTNPSETVICNSIGMIAGGNAVVFNPHPNAKEVANYAVDLVNRGIIAAGGPENLVVTVKNPTKESSDEMMAAPCVRMLVATGGPGVVRALLSSGKKA
ncbi:MAG: aldehyde dehydrogenase family protein, partial [Clostridia bacterium]|nr:aldehyde dehydrogenase family protein [Clostridia bacterium]